jgi:O-acetyl-ADP-ribose deacetylase
MITVRIGVLDESDVECVLRPIRSDFVPVTTASRDLGTAAGEPMQERLEQMGIIPVGGAVMTPGGDLGSDFVIHAVVSAPDEPETSTSVQKALSNGLRRATDMGIESLALPPLGMGVGSMEAEGCARVMLDILFNHVDEGAPPVDLRLVVEHPYEAEIFSQIIDELTDARSDGHG